ncbi:hypothetical protein H8S90_23555 [Olivibacter sp. SDN3]|uniref:hypothetical protein n=1 Tax=Olivibacter sp. SDN3 TaxID=2764720 RepID=UPI0016515A01|nr:hypothetical protein [Olivibacter sp. SDN3]QNL49656.1 hypothetical protein H8S90_23555 [Olivibacter sp. SDN3]
MKNKNSYWNCRIMAHHHSNSEDAYFAIHEIYYEKDIPVSYTENAVAVVFEELSDISDYLDKMKLALSKPVLWAGEKFPNEYIAK